MEIKLIASIFILIPAIVIFNHVHAVVDDEVEENRTPNPHEIGETTETNQDTITEEEANPAALLHPILGEHGISHGTIDELEDPESPNHLLHSPSGYHGSIHDFTDIPRGPSSPAHLLHSSHGELGSAHGSAEDLEVPISPGPHLHSPHGELGSHHTTDELEELSGPAVHHDSPTAELGSAHGPYSTTGKLGEPSSPHLHSPHGELGSPHTTDELEELSGPAVHHDSPTAELGNPHGPAEDLEVLSPLTTTDELEGPGSPVHVLHSAGEEHESPHGTTEHLGEASSPGLHLQSPRGELESLHGTTEDLEVPVSPHSPRGDLENLHGATDELEEPSNPGPHLHSPHGELGSSHGRRKWNLHVELPNSIHEAPSRQSVSPGEKPNAENENTSSTTANTEQLALDASPHSLTGGHPHSPHSTRASPHVLPSLSASPLSPASGLPSPHSTRASPRPSIEGPGSPAGNPHSQTTEHGSPRSRPPSPRPVIEGPGSPAGHHDSLTASPTAIDEAPGSPATHLGHLSVHSPHSPNHSAELRSTASSRATEEKPADHAALHGNPTAQASDSAKPPSVVSRVGQALNTGWGWVKTAHGKVWGRIKNLLPVFGGKNPKNGPPQHDEAGGH
jgi:hypothetical protein